MATWTPERTRTAGGIPVTSMRGSTEGAHRIDFPDGRMLMVLPDGVSSPGPRSRVISKALNELEAVSVDGDTGRIDLLAYVVGRLRVEAESTEHLIVKAGRK